MFKNLFKNLFKRKPKKEYNGSYEYQFRTLSPQLSFFMRGIIVKHITDKINSQTSKNIDEVNEKIKKI